MVWDGMKGGNGMRKWNDNGQNRLENDKDKKWWWLCGWNKYTVEKQYLSDCFTTATEEYLVGSQSVRRCRIK